MLPLGEPAVALSLVAAGCFFLTGLLTGVWKYLAIASSDQSEAPTYVNIAHRAALLYSFAAILLAVFAAHSAWSATVDLWAVAAPLGFFALAIGSYVTLGLFNNTDNQFKKPHRLGPLSLPAFMLHGFMWALIVAEIGGFVVLFAGLLQSLRAS